MQGDRCISIKSKKDPTLQCEHTATKGSYCPTHARCKKRVPWVKAVPVLPKGHRAAGLKILAFLKRYTYPAIRRRHGLAYFTPEIANNGTDIFTLDPVTSIPPAYRFSYHDGQHMWIFDSRFLMQNMQYERNVVNPYSQEELPASVVRRLQTVSEFLQKHSLPLLYISSEVLTPEQRWNQKVLDVFLRIRIHGYGVNVLWFETLRMDDHIQLYSRLYYMWNAELRLSEQDKERIVPDHKNLIFKYPPHKILSDHRTLKWWMKHNLSTMHTLLSASTDKANQGCGALYILTALARVHPSVAEAFPWR